ncbi:MAG: hypothetical protein PWR22_2048, partial [Moorella sp. (in: firmicutes)]|nr:hypothetical protein [Moorella sp. (in: firmicutes)]
NYITLEGLLHDPGIFYFDKVVPVFKGKRVLNDRLDQSFGFEQHFIRGLKKMSLRCALALAVMLAMALGRIREKKGENLRSLVKAA